MADDSQKLGQDDIERLLAQAKSVQPASTPPAPEKAAIESVGQDEIEKLLQQNAGGPKPPPPSAAAPVAAQMLGQTDIEALFNKSAPAAAAPVSAFASAPPVRPAADSQVKSSSVAQRDLELLLSQAEAALASVNSPKQEAPRDILPFQLEDFVGAPPSNEMATLELIRDVELDLRIEFGRTQMFLEDVLRLRRGSVVPLDKLAGDPVDIFVNGRLIARGEVLVLNDNFCVRVAELVAGEPAAAG